MNDEECEIMEANRKAWKDEEDEDWRTREAHRKAWEAREKAIEDDKRGICQRQKTAQISRRQVRCNIWTNIVGPHFVYCGALGRRQYL